MFTENICTDTEDSRWLFFFFPFETGSLCAALTDLEFTM